MDELNEKLKRILDDWAENWVDNDAWSGKWDEALVSLLPEIHAAFKDAGYIRINTGKNVVITTGDNEGGKLMTEQEWREKFNA